MLLKLKVRLFGSEMCFQTQSPSPCPCLRYVARYPVGVAPSVGAAHVTVISGADCPLSCLRVTVGVPGLPGVWTCNRTSGAASTVMVKLNEAVSPSSSVTV